MKNIWYWATTGLLTLAFAASGAANLTRYSGVIAGMARLGYPPYLSTILGAWQLLGAAAVLAPGFPRLKEWAYAGMFFDLTGAVVSHLVMADRANKVLAPLALLAVAVGSWAQRPDSRMLSPWVQSRRIVPSTTVMADPPIVTSSPSTAIDSAP